MAIIEGKGGKDRKLLDPKDMKPSVLRKQEEWKKWKEEVWDYCGAVEHGMKEVLEEVMLKKEAIEEKDVGARWWKCGKNCGIC